MGSCLPAIASATDTLHVDHDRNQIMLIRFFPSNVYFSQGFQTEKHERKAEPSIHLYFARCKKAVDTIPISV
jgi:hypothetical protein